MPGTPLIMNFPVTTTSHLLADYVARGGYKTLDKALKTMAPGDVTKEVMAAGLLGHGGAAFPVGRKWSVIKLDDGVPHYLCCNADEGEPGTFKDRWILENAPHLLVESMGIASHALGVRNAFVYIRGEFDQPYRRLQAAIDEAYGAGYLGEKILGTDFSLDIVVYRGAGSYVCGEASGLITSVEGKRGYPRNRPPRLTVRGLYQRPTVINNVETLANITGIIANGASAFRKVGTEKSPGTQMVSISGHIEKPGVYEVEYGYSWSKFLYEDCGGILGGKDLKCVIPGGISTKVLTRAEVEPTAMDNQSLAAAGSSLGSGGMIVIAEGTCMVRLLQVMLRFYHHESCGQCTPCREGMGWMHRLIDRIVAGDGRPEDIETLIRISHANDGTTICGMGDAAGYATVGILAKYRHEFEHWITHKRSLCDGRLEVAMPDFFVDDKPVHAEPGQTVLEAALAAGIFIPTFCWHPKLSIAGNCRICVVEAQETKGGAWVEIACNMAVSEGMRVQTNSPKVQQRRKETMQFITLNHPVDCGICDKAGECTLQDHHYTYNGDPSVSSIPKVHATKFHDLSERILIDNERCIMCSRCVRFTNEISKTRSLGVQERGDSSVIRAAEDGSFAADAYSDNVIDICPVGALLSKANLYKSRVWYLEPTRSVCPGCERGCSVQLWHRKPEWKLHALDQRENTAINRVTPFDNPEVNGPWICNKGRDIAKLLERPRATEAMLKGKPAGVSHAADAARRLIAAAKNPVALVSSWGSNEELASFKKHLGARFQAFVKTDCVAEADEVAEDAFLIKPDKNPNGAAARALFGSSPPAFPAGTDLVLVWGEGCNFAVLPKGVKIIFLGAYLAPENGYADVFLPVSVQTERRGHYTNFSGVVNGFEPCFAKPAGVADAESLFATLAATAEVPA